MGNMSKWFNREEFQCHHCGENEISHDLVRFLDGIRESYGSPIYVTSGYRCAEYDEQIGGSGTHPTGLAVDIGVSNNEERWRLLKALFEAGCRRVGVAERFIHVDLLYDRPFPRLWLYPEKRLKEAK